jgi:putative membrane protein
MKPKLTESDLDRIRARIARAEEDTSGEIVTFVVERSDTYEVVSWRGAALSSLLFLVITLLIYLFYQGWDLWWLYNGAGIVAGIVFFGLLGAASVHTMKPVFLAVAGSRLLAQRARARAERAFIEEGVFRTVGQTGVLIFISLWEKRIEVLPDTGIGAVVNQEDWTSVVDAARSELQRGDLVEALLASIDACGSILSRTDMKPSDTNPNELDDSVRLGE